MIETYVDSSGKVSSKSHKVVAVEGIHGEDGFIYDAVFLPIGANKLLSIKQAKRDFAGREYTLIIAEWEESVDLSRLKQLSKDAEDSMRRMIADTRKTT